MSEYKVVKIKPETYKAAKIRAAEMGMKLLDYFEYLVEGDKLIAAETKHMTPIVKQEQTT